jgi:serine/threonine protein kinase
MSGLSPFLGEVDQETLANVAAGDWDFDDPAWDDISDLGKDFICRLMVKDKRQRMTASEALAHPWITVCSLMFCYFRIFVCPCPSISLSNVTCPLCFISGTIA